MGRLLEKSCLNCVDRTFNRTLYGPPGGGKTTAVRIFAQTSGRILISIGADQQTPKDTLIKIFSMAKQLGRVIIFFDEMDRVAYQGSSHTAFLQTEMDGIIANDITVIGATNYPDRFEPAILSRFNSKILLPRLSAVDLNLPIKKSLLDCITKYNANIYFDAPLAAEMQPNSTQLGMASEGLDLRHVNASIRYLLGDLMRELERKPPTDCCGITYLRLQDVCFSFHIMRIQEHIIPKPLVDVPTATKYIQDNKLSFFPSKIPAQSVSVQSVLEAGC